MIFNTKVEELDTKEIVKSKFINWNYFKNSTILVTGATGLIGKQIVNALLYANEILNTNITIIALIRDYNKAENIFLLNKTKNLIYLVQDVVKPIKYEKKIDFVVHTANTTASKSFVETPVETINAILYGTNNVLELAIQNETKSAVYLSSMEVYGDIDYKRAEPLSETDLGYINLFKTRSSYPEAKRLAENLCFSYFSEYKVPIKIARLAQTIGAGIDYKDNRVFAQFARNIVNKNDIVLHTEGKTIRSYLYITDCVVGILLMLEKGKNGESYNIANESTTCSIKEMAEMLSSKYTTSKLSIEVENLGSKNYYLDTIKYYLNTTKYYSDTKWKANIGLEEMFERLIKAMEEKHEQ